MGTGVTIEVVGDAALPHRRAECEAAIERALDWFRDVEARCSRFLGDSEVMRLVPRAGEPVPVSQMLFELVGFAVALAHETGGAFDPTVGRAMQTRGDDTEYRTGARIQTSAASPTEASYRDVHLDERERTIRIDRALVLDLGAVAKGLAIDLAARELGEFGDFAIDVGGDLFLSGANAEGALWSVGIRHPREPSTLLATVRASNIAVCTSGNYERRDVAPHGHILDGRTRDTATACESVTVAAPLALVADALSTAAFALGPEEGLAMLERHDVAGLVVDASLHVQTTSCWCEQFGPALAAR
jgi:thiamine biosynthesis lipoprotein